MRLDKFLTLCTNMTRTEAKKIIKKGILVNDNVIKKIDYKLDETKDKVFFNGKELIYQKDIYIMLNKPKGYVSATKDNLHQTVIDLIKQEDKILDIFPVGRLDKDTEGLLLITSDGALAHKLLSPKKDIDKKYYVEVDGILTQATVDKFLNRIVIDDGYLCKPSTLEIIEARLEKSKAYITISEGKFHQIKRMMKAVGLNVTYLKRLSMSSLVLDENLELGSYRYLTQEEINQL